MYKHKIGMGMLLFGVLLLALSAYQFNQYVSAVTMAANAKTLALSQVDSAAAGMGLTADQVAAYKQEMMDQLDAGSQAYTIVADSLVPSILLDAVFGLAFAAAGILLAGSECCKEQAVTKSRK